MSVVDESKRSSAGTREQILDAADEFLLTHPFREMTVSVLMRNTDVSRPAFYQYFRDRYDIVAGLVGRLQQAIAASGQQWASGEGGAENCAAAMRHLARTVAPHGYEWKAIVDAKATDARIEELWRQGFMQQFMGFGAQLIRREQAAGNTRPDIDPELTARALCISVEAMVCACFANPNTPECDVEAVGEVWARMWATTLYGTLPSE